MHWQSSDWWKIYVLKHWCVEIVPLKRFRWLELSSVGRICRLSLQYAESALQTCLTYYSANSSRRNNVKTSKNPFLINTIISCTIKEQTSCHGRILSFPIVKLPRDIGISPKWFPWSFPILSGVVLLNHQRGHHYILHLLTPLTCDHVQDSSITISIIHFFKIISRKWFLVLSPQSWSSAIELSKGTPLHLALIDI